MPRPWAAKESGAAAGRDLEKRNISPICLETRIQRNIMLSRPIVSTVKILQLGSSGRRRYDNEKILRLGLSKIYKIRNYCFIESLVSYRGRDGAFPNNK